MMHMWILAMLAAHAAPVAKTVPATAATPATQTLIQEIAASGRCTTVAESPSSRVSTRVLIAPGLPPLLSFRYYEGRMHQRYGNTGLVLDDAGH